LPSWTPKADAGQPDAGFPDVQGSSVGIRAERDRRRQSVRMTANETISPEREQSEQSLGLAQPLEMEQSLEAQPISVDGSQSSSPDLLRHRHARRGTDGLQAARRFRYMVLASGPDDLAAVELGTGAMVRLRTHALPRTGGAAGGSTSPSGLKAFDLIDAEIAADPERDDLAHPEAVSLADYPKVVGTARKRWARRHLRSLIAPSERNLLGFAGSAAPYWEFRGMRPSLALVSPTIGPLLFRRKTDDTTWVRFGWSRSDNWLPVEDPRATESLWAARRDKLTGKDLAVALGFRPRYLLVALTPPRGGHCYKTVLALLPRP
jgi:hypothetical protein